MAIIDNAAAGWQNKNINGSVSERIHDRGQKNVREDLNSAAKTANQLQGAKTTEKPAQAEAHHETNRITQQKDIPQTVQKQRVDTQSQAGHESQASQKFVEAKNQAGMLHQLENKQPFAKTESTVVTREAVISKSEAQGAEIGKRLPNQMTALQLPNAKVIPQAVVGNRTNDAAKTDKPQVKGEPKARDTKTDEKTAKPDALQTQATPKGDAGVAAQIAGKTTVVEPSVKFEGLAETTDGPGEMEEEEKGREETYFCRGQSAAKNASGGLNTVLSGGHGSTGEECDGNGESSSSAVEIIKPRVAEKLPEVDPNFHVYSEFDEANPGVEAIKAKAQVYGKLIEKRLAEIAKFDKELDGRILSLSQRVVEEWKNELKSHNFLIGPYGGVSA